jgi:type IV secretory pathway VirB3-like protein
MKQTLEQKSQKLIKSTIQKLIAKISVFAVFAALIIVGISYAGLTFSISLKVIVSVAIPSIILALSCIILYELWIKTGRDDAKSEKEYIELLKEYQKQSSHLNEDVMQEFIEAEKQRRYNVEYNRLTHEIDRITKIVNMLSELKKLSKLEAIRLSINKRRLVKLTKARECIIIDMPYTYSEQFDQLRYAADESKLKEYKPNDTAIYVTRRRANKYTTIITTTLIGLNIVSPSIGGQNWFIALFMTLLSAIALISSLISGFSTGYNSIAVSSTGVYKTALNFIDKAEAYCAKYKKQLRYVQVEEISEIPDDINKVEETEQPQVEEVKAEESQISMDIFDNLLK